MPVEGGGEDTALSLMLGLVCERCDAYNDPGVPACVACGAPLPSVEGSGQFPAPAEPAPSEPAAPEQAQQPAHEAPRGEGWMAAPSGQPLATRFAVPKVDLATISTPAHGVSGLRAPTDPSPARPPPPTPPPASSQPGDCSKCGTASAIDDRFCRGCGQRLDAAAAPPTPVVGAIKHPSPSLPSPILAGATTVMPSFSGAASVAQQPSATMFFGAATAERTAKLVLVRGQSQFGTQWRLQAPETVLGRTDGVVLFPDDQTLAHRHCRLTWRDGGMWLFPEPSTNGVYLRLRGPTQVGPGAEFVIGAQRLRVLADADRRLHMSTPDPSTKVLGSLVRPDPAITLLRIAAVATEHEVYHRHQRLLTLGRSHCDVNFPTDGFVSERHAQLTRTDDGPLLLEDLSSRNGTYLRVTAPEKLAHGDLILLGDKVLRVELPR